MKNNMEDIDKLIKETLTTEEAKFYEELDEQGILGMIGGIFQGKNGWLMIIMNIVTVVAFGLSIYCIVQAFNTENTNELIKWSMGAFVGFMMVGMTKMFAWMQMDKRALIREIKRLEIQVSSLAGKIS